MAMAASFHPLVRRLLRECQVPQPTAGTTLHDLCSSLSSQLHSAPRDHDPLRSAHPGTRVDLASLSHELRTPLNGLLGSLELALQQTPIAPAIQVPLKNAMASGTQLLDLVNDLLALHGNLESERRRFNLREVLTTHTDACCVMARAKGIHFQAEVDPGVPTWAIGDRHRVIQVLGHLTGMALHLTKRGQVYVVADVQRGEENQTSLRIVVEDTGVGLRPAELEQITSFLTSGNGHDWAPRTNRVGEHSAALSIAICHQLLTKMGGGIHVSSTYGKGSRVEATCMIEKTHSDTVIERRLTETSARSERADGATECTSLAPSSANAAACGGVR